MTESNNSPAKTLLVSGLALLAAGSVLAWLLLSKPPEQTAPAEHIEIPETVPVQATPEPVAPPEPEASEPEQEEPVAPPEPEPEPKPPEPAVQLPSLEESDGEVRSELQENSGGALLRLLTDEYIIRKAVRAIAALADGNLVTQYRPLKEPQTPFIAKEQATDKPKETKLYRIEPNNYSRYSHYLTAFEKMGADELVQMYQHYYPLLEEAYRELGVEDNDFHAITLRAIDALLAAPSADAQYDLVQPSVMYKYADKSIESLPPAQKLMIRIGQINQQRTKALLQEIKHKLKRPKHS